MADNRPTESASYQNHCFKTLNSIVKLISKMLLKFDVLFQRFFNVFFKNGFWKKSNPLLSNIRITRIVKMKNLGPLKNVEIDFLKIKLITFVSDTLFLLLNLFVLIKRGCLETTRVQSVKIWLSYELFWHALIFFLQIFCANQKH